MFQRLVSKRWDFEPGDALSLYFGASNLQGVGLLLISFSSLFLLFVPVVGDVVILGDAIIVVRVSYSRTRCLEQMNQQMVYTWWSEPSQVCVSFPRLANCQGTTG